MMSYAASRVRTKISSRSACICGRAASRLASERPAIEAADQTGSSESPCSPMTIAWTLVVDTSKYWPRLNLSRAVSSAVPDPMTWADGRPEKTQVA